MPFFAFAQVNHLYISNAVCPLFSTLRDKRAAHSPHKPIVSRAARGNVQQTRLAGFAQRKRAYLQHAARPAAAKRACLHKYPPPNPLCRYMRAEAKRFRPLSMAGPARAMPIAEYFFNHMYTFFGLTRSASSCTMGEKARGATALYKILRK